jgi:hypothetical protein
VQTRAFCENSRTGSGANLCLSPNAVWSVRSELGAEADLDLGRRLPAVYALREFVDAGGLLSYGTDIFDVWHRAAKQIDRILAGANPADIPIEQPTKFDLVINLRAARDLAIALTPILLARAGVEPDVRFGSLADIRAPPVDVRFAFESGHPRGAGNVRFVPTAEVNCD